MDLVEFMDEVNKAPDITGISMDETDRGSFVFCVRYEPNGSVTSISSDTVMSKSAERLFGIIRGDDHQPLKYITRVIGYYSAVHNWNPSKVGELRDRQRGNYAVSQ